MTANGTTDSILLRAMDRLEAATTRVEAAKKLYDEARQDAEAWQDFVVRYRSLHGGSSPKTGPEVRNHQAGSRLPTRNSSAVVVETLERTEAVLRKEGQPVKGGQLVRLLEKVGFPISGKEPINTLSARLTRSDRFVNVRDRGWWIKGDPIPKEIGASGQTYGPDAPNDQSSHG